jgi:hypothetical protein
LEEGITTARGLGGNNFGNKATHNKFWEGWKQGRTHEARNKVGNRARHITHIQVLLEIGQDTHINRL